MIENRENKEKQRKTKIFMTKLKQSTALRQLATEFWNSKNLRRDRKKTYDQVLRDISWSLHNGPRLLNKVDTVSCPWVLWKQLPGTGHRQQKREFLHPCLRRRGSYQGQWSFHQDPGYWDKWSPWCFWSHGTTCSVPSPSPTIQN